MRAFNKRSKPKHHHTKRKYRRIVNCDKIILTKYLPSQYMMWVDLKEFGLADGLGVYVSNSTYVQLLNLAKSKQHILYDNVVFESDLL